jgi:hypothetical protein
LNMVKKLHLMNVSGLSWFLQAFDIAQVLAHLQKCTVCLCINE